MIQNLARLAFSLLCHQDPARSWAPAGVPAALCQRCAGVYMGAFFALFLFPLARFKPGTKILCLHGAFLLQGAVLALAPLAQPGWIRTLSGQIFAQGALYFLWLHILFQRRLLKEGAAPFHYFAGLLFSLFFVQIIVHYPIAVGVTLIHLFSLMGLLALMTLVVISIFFLIRRPEC